MAKQVKFKDLENNAIHSGILLDDGNLICGECGGLLEDGDRGSTWEIIKEYENWVDLDDEILGEDYSEDETDTVGVTPCGCCYCSSYEEMNSRRGSCYKYGGSVCGSNFDDCVHGTGGMLIYGDVDSSRKQITATPVMIQGEKTPEQVVNLILEQPDTNEGFRMLQKDIKAFLEENGLEDFRNVALSFEVDR